MTIEQIELRKILTQMLADNGLNRETIKDFVREIIEEKIDKSIDDIIHQTSGDRMVNSVNKRVDRFIDSEIDKVARAAVRDQIKSYFSNISVSVKLVDPSATVKRTTTKIC